MSGNTAAPTTTPTATEATEHPFPTSDSHPEGFPSSWSFFGPDQDFPPYEYKLHGRTKTSLGRTPYSAKGESVVLTHPEAETVVRIPISPSPDGWWNCGFEVIMNNGEEILHHFTAGSDPLRIELDYMMKNLLSQLSNTQREIAEVDTKLSKLRESDGGSQSDAGTEEQISKLETGKRRLLERIEPRRKVASALELINTHTARRSILKAFGLDDRAIKDSLVLPHNDF